MRRRERGPHRKGEREVAVGLGDAAALLHAEAVLRVRVEPGRGADLQTLWKIGKISKISAGSFSAVSKRNFARKYAFDSIFQALQDLHPFAPLQSQNFRKKSV